MNPSVRRAACDDIPAIAGLAGRIWRAHYPEIISPEQIEYMLRLMYSPASLAQQMEGGHTFWILENDAIPVGYASVEAGGKTTYTLHKFYIDAALHRRGLGQTFLHHLMAHYAPCTMELTVNRCNITAVNFYFRMGFVIAGILNKDIGQGFLMEDFIMRKALN